MPDRRFTLAAPVAAEHLLVLAGGGAPFGDPYGPERAVALEDVA